MSEEPSKHKTVLVSSETVNIKKLANLTANTKNHGQITLLNTKSHSDPQAAFTLGAQAARCPSTALAGH